MRRPFFESISRPESINAGLSVMASTFFLAKSSLLANFSAISQAHHGRAVEEEVSIENIGVFVDKTVDMVLDGKGEDCWIHRSIISVQFVVNSLLCALGVCVEHYCGRGLLMHGLIVKLVPGDNFLASSSLGAVRSFCQMRWSRDHPGKILIFFRGRQVDKRPPII